MVFVLSLVKGGDRFKEFCVFCLAGGAAGTVAWIILQPDISVVVAVGVNALVFRSLLCSRLNIRLKELGGVLPELPNLRTRDG
jgi:Flp pilus assembly protein TadB